MCLDFIKLFMKFYEQSAQTSQNSQNTQWTKDGQLLVCNPVTKREDGIPIKLWIMNSLNAVDKVSFKGPRV